MIRSFQQDNVFAAYHGTREPGSRRPPQFGHQPGSDHPQDAPCPAQKRAEIRPRPTRTLETGGHSATGRRLRGAPWPTATSACWASRLALMCEPKLLMLDEPLAGMNPVEVDEHPGSRHAELWEGGLTILLIEHNMRAAMTSVRRFNVSQFRPEDRRGYPRRDPEQSGSGPSLPGDDRPMFLELKGVSVYYGHAAMAVKRGQPCPREEGTDHRRDRSKRGWQEHHPQGSHRPASSCGRAPIEMDGKPHRQWSTRGKIGSSRASPCVPEEQEALSLHERAVEPQASEPTCARTRRASQEHLEGVFALFPRLKERLRQKAGSLSGGRAADAGHRPGP